VDPRIAWYLDELINVAALRHSDPSWDADLWDAHFTGAVDALVVCGLMSYADAAAWHASMEAPRDYRPTGFDGDRLIAIVPGSLRAARGFRALALELYADGVSVCWKMRLPRWRRAPPLARFDLEDDRNTWYQGGLGAGGGGGPARVYTGEAIFQPPAPPGVRFFRVRTGRRVFDFHLPSADRPPPVPESARERALRYLHGEIEQIRHARRGTRARTLAESRVGGALSAVRAAGLISTAEHVRLWRQIWRPPRMWYLRLFMRPWRGAVGGRIGGEDRGVSRLIAVGGVPPVETPPHCVAWDLLRIVGGPFPLSDRLSVRRIEVYADATIVYWHLRRDRETAQRHRVEWNWDRYQGLIPGELAEFSITDDRGTIYRTAGWGSYGDVGSRGEVTFVPAVPTTASWLEVRNGEFHVRVPIWSS
jgi:hypothetical protein